MSHVCFCNAVSYLHSESSRSATVQSNWRRLGSCVRITITAGMYRVMDDFDPMILESRLLYPKTLDETVLVAREKVIQKVLLPKDVAHDQNVVVASSGYMEVTERGGAP